MKKMITVLMLAALLLLGACTGNTAVSNSSDASEEKVVTVFSSPT